MNSDQIARLLSHIPNFLGVFASDSLPAYIPFDFSLVVNTDPSDKPGLHWQAIIVQNGIAYFFCSFGGIPKNKFISQFCNQFSVVYFNQRKHQRINESTCGAYCVYVINEMYKGRTFNSIIGTFKRVYKDDAFVKKYLLNHFSFHL